MENVYTKFKKEIMSKQIIFGIQNLCLLLLFFSCRHTDGFQGATAAWTFADANDATDGDVYIESKLGSDDIAGLHLLKYKLQKDEISKWHDILFRFNGKQSELYVDGVLRDDEVTAGEIRMG
ncbi:hypothetical protein AGMMS50239_32260 [Bacteroidia bacterium]|nr:hypothetical protein AGMMS50239_32260 [Bacteroidia bacterium]